MGFYVDPEQLDQMQRDGGQGGVVAARFPLREVIDEQGPNLRILDPVAVDESGRGQRSLGQHMG